MKACKHCGSPDRRYCVWPGNLDDPRKAPPCELESLGYEVPASENPRCLPIIGAVSIVFWAGIMLTAFWLAGFLKG